MLTFRDATADQAGLISHIYATSWRKTYRGHIAQHYLDRLPDEYWVPSIRSWLSSGQLYGLMVYDDDKPVGCCIYGRGRDEDYGDWCEIVSLYLLPDTMRQGIGGKLLEEVIRLMQLDGYEKFYLWAIDGNEIADGFYRKHGFCARMTRSITKSAVNPCGTCGIRAYYPARNSAGFGFCRYMPVAISAVSGAAAAKPNDPTSVLSSCEATYFRLMMSVSGVPCPAKYISIDR